MAHRALHRRGGEEEKSHGGVEEEGRGGGEKEEGGRGGETATARVEAVVGVAGAATKAITTVAVV